jgi:protein-disulfide isomerase
MRPLLATPFRRLALVLGATALLAGSLATVSLLGAASHEPPAAAPVESSAFEGIAQRGAVLGRVDAPVTLIEYADIQCPFCAEWSREALPTIVRDYVRTGKVRVEFRGLAFLGPDSETALRAVISAGGQNRLWDVVEQLYLRQGPENAGWVTEDLLDEVAAAVPGLDAGRLDAQREAAWVTDAILATARQSGEAGVPGTPAFQVGPTGGPLELVDSRGVQSALERALAS